VTTITLLGFDIETVGMAPPSSVIELGWSSLTIDPSSQSLSEHGEMQGSVLFGMREGEVMSSDNRAVHHIDPASLVGLPLFDPVEWGGTALNDTEFLFAHNAEFEQQWLSAIAPDLPWVCTYKVALRLLPDAPSHSNGALKYELGIPDHPSHHPPHRAHPDCVVTALVLEQLLVVAQQQAPTASMEAILASFVEITREPRLLPRCPIGKFRGRPWAEVESGFLSWVLRQQDMEADLKWCAERELTRRR
jgi:exodeoxyribonuclease X